MQFQENIIDITTIIFVSNDSEVLVKGTVSKGHMSYTTDLHITTTQLNTILNEFNRNNDGFSINHYLNSEQIDENETLYYATFDNDCKTTVNLSSIELMEPLKQVRA